MNLPLLTKIVSTIIFVFFPLQIFAATSFSKYENNPLITPNQQGWDHVRVFSPSVIRDNSEFKMFYTGFDGSRYQIGLAHSSNGLTWVKDNSNPILSRIASLNKDTHEPAALFNGNSYEVWYGTSDNGGSSNFAIYRAISPNGVDWLDEPLTPVLKPSSGWGATGVAAPFVIKTGGEYKMWFSAATTGNWAIGYASSLDGINWTPYGENPVLKSDAPWDFSQLSGPTVIYDGTNYHMWYNTNNFVSPSRINYAVSSDGIHWSKPADLNPVIPLGQAGDWDSQAIGDGSAVKIGDTTYLWYGGLGPFEGQNAWRIGLATDKPITNPTVSPTPPPTSTPTPTPTATPTPTPTPIPTTKVVVIPGLGASWNNNAMLNCKATNYSGDWFLASYAEKYYEPLISALEQAGFSPKPFYYDWRRPVTDNVAPLSAFINVRTLENEKVNLVGHSMGGLVGRAYLENKTTNNKLDKLLSVGSPHKGTLMAYPAWSAGEVQGDLLLRIGATVATKLCGATYLNQRQVLQRSFPSVQNLLPVFDYLRDWRSDSLKPVAQMHAQNNWLPTTTFVPPFWNVTVGSLVGVGVKTPKFIKVKDRSALDTKLGNWEDGKPAKTEETLEGDGTVLMTSSQIDGTFNTFINKSHSGLVASPEGIEEILNFLGMPSVTAKKITASLTFTEPKSALFFLSDAGAFWIIDQQGKTIKDKGGLVAVLNPQSGSYQLRLLPKAVKSRFIVAQFLEDGKTLWKEYNLSNILPKFKTIIFNHVNPLEDVLK